MDASSRVHRVCQITEQNAAKDGDVGTPLMSEDSRDSNRIPPITEDSTTPSADDDDDAVAQKISKAEENQSGAGNSQDKPLKKPDKILPCPRCDSLDTKFCYFNIYNVNQPMLFCKNCHRYWTAGGTMRNVPVGAGRCKNKHTLSQFRHLTVREALQGAPGNIPNVMHPAAMNPDNSTVLTTQSEAPQSSTSPNSPTLVKHSRDDNLLKQPNENGKETQEESSSRKSLRIPKTLRIDDPKDTAKSSIGATLGIKHNSVNSLSGAGPSKTMQTVMKNLMFLKPLQYCKPIQRRCPGH